MHRSSRSWLRRAWRAVEPRPWFDVALAAVFSIAAVWMVVAAAGTLASEDRPGPVGAGPTPPVPPGFLLEPTEPPGWTWLGLLLTLLMTVPLAGRRRWPLFCFAAQITGLLAYDDGINAAMLAALLVGAYSLTVYQHYAPLSMGALLVAALVTAVVKTDTWPELPGWAGVFAILLPVGLFGIAIRAARGRARSADQRTAAIEREQQSATGLAVAQERARIARELHDVVSHHVSVMTIQAGAAGKVIDADPDLARGALSAIEASGRETMAELRHLLGALGPGPAEQPLRPQPGLDQLDTLVENVRRTGQPVSVRRTPVTLSRGMDLTAYRVVQEALTNSLRYAPGARIDIAITTQPPAAHSEGRPDLVIEVRNGAPSPGARPVVDAADGSGSGLLGLAERLRLYGGTLTTGRLVGGGFAVQARVPLEGGT